MIVKNETQHSTTKNNKLVKQFIAYLFVGGIAFVVNTIILLLVRNYMGSLSYSLQIADAAGGILGFAVGFFVNYYLSLLFVFKAKSSMKDFIVVLIIGIVGLFMTTGGLVVLNANLGIPILLAQCIITAIVFFWNFVARKLLVYRDN